MYIFTAQELKQIHEERIGLDLNHNIASQDQKLKQKPTKRSVKNVLSAMLLKLN